MGDFYRMFVRPGLFRRDPEEAHDQALRRMQLLQRIPGALALLRRGTNVPGRPLTVAGLEFPNGVGLGAGFDKNGEVWRAAGALGFGHVEIGTVTPKPQEGNPRPRMFRYPEQNALVNRMGFNNAGVEAVAENLRRSGADRFPHEPILGVSIGANKTTPHDQAPEDYRLCTKTLVPFADYLAVNVSSPNTPGLRDLQAPEYLKAILQAVQSANALHQRPVFVKIAPDLRFAELEDLVPVALENGAAGFIATNTTIARSGDTANCEIGGLSGSPLHPRSLEVVRFLRRLCGDKAAIIGSGGAMGRVSAGRFLDNGASLVQLYTGLVYEGPFVARDVAAVFAQRQSDWAGA